jgi:hypothetical protein
MRTDNLVALIALFSYLRTAAVQKSARNDNSLTIIWHDGDVKKELSFQSVEEDESPTEAGTRRLRGAQAPLERFLFR